MCIRDSPYTSQYDADQMNNGWFVPSMPDLNQKNPHVYRYLVQNLSLIHIYCVNPTVVRTS